MKIILSILLISMFFGCSDEKQVPRSKVIYQLKTYFQERFIKLECIGNNKTYKIIDKHAVPSEVDLTFKAQIKIDGKLKTIVGDMRGTSGLTVHGFGKWTSDPEIFFTITLKDDWHFVKPDEKTEYFCLGDGFSIKKLFFSSADESAFNFDEHNIEFTVDKFWHEARIAEKMCLDGDKKYCSYYDAYMNSKVHTRYNDKTGRRKIYNAFKSRYFHRLCEKNIPIACRQLDIISDK